MDKINRAYEFAREFHRNQRRRSGEPYINHPVEVAIILAGLHMDVETICAALLHDTIEDTDTTRVEVINEFGESVADLVEGVEQAIQGKDCTFSAFVIAAVRAALNDLKS